MPPEASSSFTSRASLGSLRLPRRSLVVAQVGPDKLSVRHGWLLGESLAVRGGGRGALLGRALVAQTAHEAPAAAGDLGGVEAQALVLRHADGDGIELLEVAAAAEGAAAVSVAPEEPRLVPHPHLAHLDAHVEPVGQVPHQLAEVHPPLGGVDEEEAALVEIVVGLHELHFQVRGPGLVAAVDERLALHLAVPLALLAVLFAGHPEEAEDLAGSRIGLDEAPRLEDLAVGLPHFRLDDAGALSHERRPFP